MGEIATRAVPRARRSGPAVWTALAATGMLAAAVTSMVAVVPSVGRELAATNTETQWMVDATAVVLAALLLPVGALLDRYGRRRGLILGLALIAFAQAWCALASTPGELIAARAMVGIAGAIMFPATLSTITAMVAPERRAAAVGMWAAVYMGAGAVGLVVAGVMVEPFGALSYNWVVAGVALGCVAGALAWVPETRDPARAHVDPLGSLLALIGVGGLVLATIELPVRGLDDPVVAGGYLLGGLAVAAFVVWELQVLRPLLDVRLFKNRLFAIGNAGVFLIYVGVFGWFFVSFLYYAFVLGYDTVEASAGLVPTAIPAVICAISGPYVAARYGYRLTIAVSLLVTGLGTLILALVGDLRELLPIVLGFIVLGFGLGLSQGPASHAIVEALPREKQGVASAMNDTMRELGFAVGVAIFGAAFNAAYRAEMESSLADRPRLLEVARDSPGAALELAASGRGARVLPDAVADATVAGWESALLLATLVFVLGAAGVWRYGTSRVKTASRVRASSASS